MFRLNHIKRYFEISVYEVIIINGILFDVVFSEKESVSNSQGTSTHIFYIAVGCVCALIILVALAVAFYYISSQKANNRAYGEKIR